MTSRTLEAVVHQEKPLGADRRAADHDRHDPVLQRDPSAHAVLATDCQDLARACRASTRETTPVQVEMGRARIGNDEVRLAAHAVPDTDPDRRAEHLVKRGEEPIDALGVRVHDPDGEAVENLHRTFSRSRLP